MRIEDILLEKKAKEKEKKIIFLETDPQAPFPVDTIAALKQYINREAKDLNKSWISAIQLVDFVFEDSMVPKPGAYLKHRFRQYLDLLKIAVDALSKSRGMESNWTVNV